MTSNSYYRDEIIRACLHAIDKGEDISQSISNAVDSAMEFAALRALYTPESGNRKALTKRQWEESAFMSATRRQLPGPPLPPEDKKPSDWWKL